MLSRVHSIPFWIRFVHMKPNAVRFFFYWLRCCTVFDVRPANHHLTTNLPAHFLGVCRWHWTGAHHLLISLSFLVLVSDVIRDVVFFTYCAVQCAIRSAMLFVKRRRQYECEANEWNEKQTAKAAFIVCIFVFVFCIEWHGKVPLLLAKLFN